MQERGQIRSAEKSFCQIGTQCIPTCREFDLQLPELPSFDSLPTEQSFTDGKGVTGGGGGDVSGVDVTTTSTIEDILGHSQNPGNETIVDSDCCSISTTIGLLIAFILVVILILIFLIVWRFRRKRSAKLRDKYYPGKAEAANGGGKNPLTSEQVPLQSWVRTPTLGPKSHSAEPVGESPSQVDVAEVPRIIDSETSLSQNISDDPLGQPEVRETLRPMTGLAADERSTVVDLPMETQVPLNSGAHTSNLGSNAERPKPVGENASQVGVSKGPKLVCVRSRTLPQVSSVNPLLVIQPEVPKILHSKTFPQDKSDRPLGQPEMRETHILPAESMVAEE